MIEAVLLPSAPAVIRFGEANRGRVTGWSITCDRHGVMPVLMPGRAAAVSAAVAHRDHEHDGRAVVKELGKRKRKRGRRA